MLLYNIFIHVFIRQVLEVGYEACNRAGYKKVPPYNSYY